MEKNYEYNINKNSPISLSTIKRIKRQVIKALKEDNANTNIKLGTQNPVQVDESVIIKGKLVNSPSEKHDVLKNAVWIVGAVEEKTRELILEIVPNRKKETFLIFFQKYINPNSEIKTDGHRSYPYAVAGIESKHIIVNHQQGFTNSDGHHTNLIECEWSLFKADIKTRKGVPGFAMGNYLEEYLWRRRNIKDRSSKTLKLAFIRLLSLLLSPK